MSRRTGRLNRDYLLILLDIFSLYILYTSSCNLLEKTATPLKKADDLPFSLTNYFKSRKLLSIV